MYRGVSSFSFVFSHDLQSIRPDVCFGESNVAATFTSTFDPPKHRSNVAVSRVFLIRRVFLVQMWL